MKRTKLFPKANYKGIQVNMRYSAALQFNWLLAICPRRVAYMLTLWRYGYKSYSYRAERWLNSMGYAAAKYKMI